MGKLPVPCLTDTKPRLGVADGLAGQTTSSPTGSSIRLELISLVDHEMCFTNFAADRVCARPALPVTMLPELFSVSLPRIQRSMAGHRGSARPVVLGRELEQHIAR
jgi:hypothetical protein